MNREDIDLIFRNEYRETLQAFSHILEQKEENEVSKKYFGSLDTEYKEKGYFTLKEKNLFKEEDSLLCTFHFNDGYVKMPHRHDFFEIIYVYSGNIIHYIGNEELHLSSGDICILNPNAVHSFEKSEKELIVINILIKKEMFDNARILPFVADNIVYNFFADCLRGRVNAEYYLVRGGGYFSNPEIFNYLNMTIVEFLKKETYYQKYVYHNFLLFCLEVTRFCVKEQTNEINQSIGDGNIERILTYIADHFRTVTIESVANKFHYHPTYLPQLLKKHTGKTFTEIQQMLRISIAKDRLLHTCWSIDAISKHIGYSNTTHFYRIFKKSTGMSPALYRKSMKKQQLPLTF